MTAEKMTLAEALDVAIASAENVWIVHGTFDETQCRQAAAVLREFRERGLPFFEAAKRHARHSTGQQTRPVPMDVAKDYADTFRRLTTEG